MDSILFTPQVRQRISDAASEQAALAAIPAPQIAPPNMGTPSMPTFSVPPINVSRSQMLTDEDALNTVRNKPAGGAQLHNPFLKGLARTADVLGSVFAPGLTTAIPGTTLHHNYLVSQAEHNLANDQATRASNDAAAQSEALTDYTQQRPEIEQAKIQQKISAANNKNAAAVSKYGLVQSVDPDTNEATYTENPDSQAYQVQAARMMLQQAQAEEQRVLAQRGQPGSPLYEQKQQELDDIRKRIQIAQGQLALRGVSVGLARQNQEAGLFGTVDGQELPGILHDANGTPVGIRNAANVKPTTNERDAAGRAEDMTAIQGRIEAALKDPEITDYMGPVGGRLAEAEGKLGTLPAKVAQFQNDLVSYGAFQAGLHPVRGIGALEYFDRVMGGLHQTPEQLRGKLASNAATSGTVQQEGTMPTRAGQSRAKSAPNVPALSGGTLPKAIADSIQEGHEATLSDGSVWRKTNGTVEQVKK